MSLRWVRTNRRAPGHDTARRPGPWHIVHEYGQTWCGKRPGLALSAQHRSLDDGDLPGDRVCAECVERRTQDRARPFGR